MDALPNLVIIGAMKCGTTSLHHYLDQHPEIQMSEPKELNFFTWEERWAQGPEWYASHFDVNAPVRGEATPKYSKYPLSPDVPARMHAVIPEAKLIYVVGDPLKRIVAHWVDWYTGEVDLAAESVNAVNAGRPLPEVLDGFEDPRHPYVSPSRYATQLERYLRFFPPAQIKVIDQEDLRARREATLRDLFGFLEVDTEFSSEQFDALFNRGAEKARPRAGYSRLRRRALAAGLERIPSRLRAPIGGLLRRSFSRPVERPTIDADHFSGLTALLADEASRLRVLTGQPFPRWSV